MIIRVFSVIMLLMITSMVAMAEEPDLLAELASRLVFHDGVKGDFRQEKHLYFMNSPFVSTGHFSMHRVDGLEWHVFDPVESVMTVREGQVLLDGKTVKDRGVGKLMAHIMRGFMNGELSRLGKAFRIEGETRADHWDLILSPISSPLNQILSHILLTGENRLHSIEVVEENGTRTTIIFSNVRETGPGQRASSG